MKNPIKATVLLQYITVAFGCSVRLTHRADEPPKDRSFRGHGHQHLQDGPATRGLHFLAVLGEAVDLHHEETLQQWRVHLWNLSPGTKRRG